MNTPEFAIDNKGWLEGVRKTPSPNYFELEDREVSLLVIHCISLPPGEFGGPHVEELFLNKLNPEEHPFFAEIHELRVAAHLFVRRGGEVQQFVSFDHCAHHAGVSSFMGREKCNEFSIGIELEGTETGEYEQAQYEVLADLTKSLMERYPKITQERIASHSDIAPDRKKDPGPGFDWDFYKTLVSQGE